MPELPAHLDDEARAEWARIAPELKRLGLLTRIDRAALALYCVVWSRWVFAEIQINDQGPVVEAPKTKVRMHNPFVSISHRAQTQMLRLLTEFGLTPSARSRIRAIEPPGDDDFEKFLAENR